LNRIYHSVVLVTAIIVLAIPTVVQAEHSFEFGAGVPRGVMLFSGNSFLNISLKTAGHFKWQPVLHNSSAVKKSGGEWLALNVLAGYGLLRYDFNESRTGWVPFIAAGGGVHFITSYASSGSPLDDSFKLKLLAKTHGFVGIERTHGSNKHLSLKVRLTYPSDLLLDAVYFNYGIRF